MRDDEFTELLNEYLKGSIIKSIKMSDSNIEGGLSIIFETDNKKGIVVFGYTELGIWIEYLKFDKEEIEKSLDEELIKECEDILNSQN